MERRLSRKKEVRCIRLVPKNKLDLPLQANTNCQSSHSKDNKHDSINCVECLPGARNSTRIQPPIQSLISPQLNPDTTTSPNIALSPPQKKAEAGNQKTMIQILLPNKSHPWPTINWPKTERASKQSSHQGICKTALTPPQTTNEGFSKSREVKRKPESNCFMISKHQGDQDEVTFLDVTATALNLEALLENMQPKHLQLVSSLSVDPFRQTKTL